MRFRRRPANRSGASRLPVRWPPRSSSTPGWLLAVGDTGEVEAFRAADGQRLWTQSLGARPRSPAIAGDNDAIYFTLANGRVVSLSLSDGSSRWSQQLPGMLSEPASAEGRVFVGSTNNVFYALDAETGELEWKWSSGGDVNGAAAYDDLVFITSLDNAIRAVNRGNGNQRWRKATGSRPVVPPRAFRGVVIVSGIAKTLTRVLGQDRRAGRELCRSERPAGPAAHRSEPEAVPRGRRRRVARRPRGGSLPGRHAVPRSRPRPAAGDPSRPSAAEGTAAEKVNRVGLQAPGSDFGPGIAAELEASMHA